MDGCEGLGQAGHTGSSKAVPVHQGESREGQIVVAVPSSHGGPRVPTVVVEVVPTFVAP